ncbi:MAG TPA: hypothetical protein DDZ89_13635 [Clostridiales bacterium]|nr:hypothetical protein [Clostridiales bacterium]
MISCTEFIPAYSELFKYLEEKGSKKKVMEFWEYISDEYLNDSLKKSVEEAGIRGCWNYWSHSLNEEAAAFTMTLDEDEGEFTITMHDCPSKRMLLNMSHMEPYHDYCGHCDVLYRRVLEPLGYEYIFDDSQTDNAKCNIKIRKIR